MSEIERNEEMTEDMYMTLSFEDGEDQDCLIIGVFEVNGKEYIALDPEIEDDIYLYGYREVGEDEFELYDIEDDAEFEAVFHEFEAIMEQIGE